MEAAGRSVPNTQSATPASAPSAKISRPLRTQLRQDVDGTADQQEDVGRNWRERREPETATHHPGIAQWVRIVVDRQSELPFDNGLEQHWLAGESPRATRTSSAPASGARRR